MLFRFEIDINILVLFVILSWMLPCAMLVKSIVSEKEERLKEMMRIMGLNDAIHWIAWGIQSLAFNFISVILISSLLKVS